MATRTATPARILASTKPKLRRLSGAWRVTKRVAGRTLEDGFIHAGNLAYLSLTTLFPFFIIVAAITGAFGRTQDGLRAVAYFMETVPPDVANLLAKPISDVIARRSGDLLTFGILVGLWSVTSYIETIRDIIRRAYGTPGGSIWRHRAMSIAGTIAAVLLMLVAFGLNFALVGASQFVANVLPWAKNVVSLLGISRLAPAIVLFLALNALFFLLTPRRFRGRYPHWPGALLTMVVWMAATTILPFVLSSVANYDLTYGSLAGVMIALLFFFIVGLGLVVGAHLNAVLAHADPTTRREKAAAAKA